MACEQLRFFFNPNCRLSEINKCSYLFSIQYSKIFEIKGMTFDKQSNGRRIAVATVAYTRTCSTQQLFISTTNQRNNASVCPVLMSVVSGRANFDPGDGQREQQVGELAERQQRTAEYQAERRYRV